MQSVGVIADIHGNLDALTAVLEDIAREQVEAIVVAGDVLPGPMPAEVVTRLLALDVPVHAVRGNGDRVVLAHANGEDISEVPGPVREVIQWTAQRLDGEHLRWIASWPATCEIRVDGLGDVFVCHATPRNDTDIFTRATPVARLLPLFGGLRARIAVCGHTHMQFDRRIGPVRVLNAGSVGMPFAPPPGAYWLQLGGDVTFRRTEYDLERAARRIRETSYPQAESLAVRYVLTPPSEAQSLEMLAATEIRDT